MATFNINEVARRIQYTVGASNRAGPYNFSFQVNAASELQVYQNDTLLTDSVQYNATVSTVNGTGSITFIDNSGSGGTNYTPAQNDIVTIIGDQPLSRTTVFQTGQANNPTTLETEFDNIVIRQQQIKEITDRAIQLKPSTTRTVTGSGTSGPLQWPYDATVSNNADKVIAYDSNGTSLILGPTTAGITALSAISSDLTTLAGISSNITTVAGISSNVTSVANIASNVSAVGGSITNVNTVASNISSINTVATNITKVVAVADDLAEAVSEVVTVADDLNEATSEIDTVATNIANVNTVGNAISNINTVAGISSNVTTVAGIASDVTTVANANSNVSSVAGSISNVNTVATNLSGVNSFAERYRVQAGVPTSSNDVGDLVFDTTANKLKVFDGSSYALAGSSVNGTSQRFLYTASAGQTTFSGSDDNSNTLTYDVAGGTAFADIYLNGVKLAPADFTATNGTSIVLGSAAAVNDILQVVSFGTFSLQNQNANNITSGTLAIARIADGSVTNDKLAGSIANAKLSNSSITINGSAVALGGSVTVGETKPTVANVSQTIAPSSATTINITGTNFVSIPIVDFVNASTGAVTRANTVSFTNNTTLSVNLTLASGNYFVRIENPDGNAGRSTNNIITASVAPTWTTSAGSLGSIAGNFSGTVATVAGTSDSTVAYSETTNVLTNASQANCTLNSSTGVITTSDFGGSSTSPTTYNFTLRLTDAEGQTADRAFSLTSSFGATGGGQFN